MGGDPKGGKVCWPSTGGSAATTAWLEKQIDAGGLNFQWFGAGEVNLSWIPPAITGKLYEIAQEDDNIPIWWRPPTNFDATAQMQVAFWGAYTGLLNSPSTHTLRLQGRFHGHMSDPKINFVNFTDIDFTITNTDRIWTTAMSDWSPDSSWSLNNIILGRISRRDSESDDPMVGGLTIRYRVNLP